MARYKNENWNLPEGTPNGKGGRTHGYDSITVSVLMDIRDELQKLNALLHCSNFQDIPRKLDRIRVTVSRLDKRVATKVPLK